MKRRAAETQQREAQGREIGVQARESKNLSAKHSRIIGISVSTTMRSFKFFFGVMLGELILCHSDNLSRTLEVSHVSAAECQMTAAITVKNLQSMRNEEDFKMLTNLM